MWNFLFKKVFLNYNSVSIIDMGYLDFSFLCVLYFFSLLFPVLVYFTCVSFEMYFSMKFINHFKEPIFVLFSSYFLHHLFLLSFLLFLLLLKFQFACFFLVNKTDYWFLIFSNIWINYVNLHVITLLVAVHIFWDVVHSLLFISTYFLISFEIFFTYELEVCCLIFIYCIWKILRCFVNS